MSESDNGAEAAVTGARVLVIDDEEIVHASLRKILSRFAHQVTSVLSAADGIAALGDQEFDLVITDLMMPEMNGIELLEHLKANGPRVPVLMLTGYPTIKTAVQALRLGAVDYLAKPYTRQELLAPVNRALRRASGLDADTGRGRTPTGNEDGIEAPSTGLRPGDRFCLRKHSWALFRQDGAMEIGIEATFLGSVGDVRQIEVPRDGDLIEQGYVSFKLETASREVHGVLMPLSGQVVDVHHQAIADPTTIDADTWIVRIIPTNLEAELTLLKSCVAG